MKKFIILAAIIPSIILGQRPLTQADKKWEKDIIEYRSENGPELVRSASLDAIAKERFLLISKAFLGNKMSYSIFIDEFGKNNHGVPSIGLDPFNVFAGDNLPGREMQEILAYFSTNYQADNNIVANYVNVSGGFINVYKRSKSHWEAASGNIPAISIERKYNGRLHKWIEVQKPMLIHNSKFGSYSGILEIVEDGIKKSVVMNVSIFE